MELIILVIVFGFGVAIGWVSRERYAMRVVSELIKQAEAEAEEHPPEKDRTRMLLERHGELIYAFEADGHTFIAQGKDLEDLDKAICARFPGKKFSVQEQNLIDIKADYHESV